MLNKINRKRRLFWNIENEKDTILELERLSQDKTVTVLILDIKKQISTEAAKALANVLPQCAQLTSLTLYNRISAEGAEALVDALPQCPKLTSLTFYHDGFDSTMPSLDIYRHDKGSNVVSVIEALGPALPHCPLLSSIKLKGIVIVDKEAKALSNALPLCAELSSIVFLQHNFIRAYAGLAALAPTLPQCVKLSSIDFKDSKLDNKDAKALANVLPNCAQLSRINLSDNHIGADGLEALVKVLPQCVKLSWIQLTNIHKKQLNTDYLSIYERELFERERKLNAQAHAQEEAYWVEVVTALANALPLCYQLSSIGFSANNIGDEGAKALAEVLPQCSQLTSIDLHGNGISDEGAKALAVALPQTPQFTEISIGGNKISAEGLKAMAAALPQCAKLTRVSLENAGIGDEGAKALAKVLPLCALLSSIALDSNRIKNEGGEALIDALAQNGIARYLVNTGSYSISMDRTNWVRFDDFRKRNTQWHDKLFEACSQGNLIGINECLEEGVSLLSKGSDRRGKLNTPLMEAVLNNQVDVAAQLINVMRQKGLPLTQTNKKGCTAANLAQQSNSPGIRALFNLEPPKQQPTTTHLPNAPASRTTPFDSNSNSPQPTTQHLRKEATYKNEPISKQTSSNTGIPQTLVKIGIFAAAGAVIYYNSEAIAEALQFHPN